MNGDGERIAAGVEADLIRQGFAPTDEDVRAVAKIVAGARAGLAKARLRAGAEPEVPCGFLPPGLAAQGPPDDPGHRGEGGRP
jgi:hypothetical protein